jgi:diguanylate cyclase (GGDEF)-like protein
MDPETGVYDERQLRISIEAELSRSRRFGRTFSLVLVGIDEMRQRFDYRDEALWKQSFTATADLLRGTRHNVDRVYRFGDDGFALILPESGPDDVNGLVRRLRRVARRARPAEGEPGGPLPAYFGATFFPVCATSTDDLLRRAEIALRIADKNANRVQLDSAEAPEMAPVETMRQPELEIVSVEETIDVEKPVQLPVPALAAVPEPAYEVDEEPPVEVYALHAPEPAVEEYAHSWQSEAPLSVLPKPRPRPQLVGMEGGAAEKPKDSIDASVNDALKRLDETLELIRSLKQRSA